MKAEYEKYVNDIQGEISKMHQNINHKLDTSILNDIKVLIESGILQIEYCTPKIEYSENIKEPVRASLSYNLRFTAEKRIQELEHKLKEQSEWVSDEDIQRVAVHKASNNKYTWNFDYG
jgi:hypothetical protein